MAVEARHLNLFSPQMLPNREVMMNSMEANAGFFNSHVGYDAVSFPGETAVAETTLFPMQSSVNNFGACAPLMPQFAKPAVKSVDSSVTFNGKSNGYVAVSSRKRPREDSVIDPLFFQPSIQSQKSCTPFSFLGHDISLQLQQQQLDIDRLISHHMERMKIEIEEKRKEQSRRLLATIELGLMKRLRTKEVEIEKMGKLNHALEERVKSLCVENQIWRDLAQSNEAAANALRTNLEQVLAAQVKDVGTSGVAGAEEEDAESCCASSGWGDGGDEAAKAEERATGRGRLCRRCGKAEACVLVLPCSHLCLCTMCGSALHTCPVCNSPKNASVHVNMS